MTFLIKYNIVCSSCGTLVGQWWRDSGLEALNAASKAGWGYGGDDRHLCPDCLTGNDWAPIRELPIIVKGTVPADFQEASLRCQCGKETKRQSGKCRGCGEEIVAPSSKRLLIMRGT